MGGRLHRRDPRQIEAFLTRQGEEAPAEVAGRRGAGAGRSGIARGHARVLSVRDGDGLLVPPSVPGDPLARAGVPFSRVVYYIGVYSWCLSSTPATRTRRDPMATRRFSVTLDAGLLEEAVRLSGADSQREAIETALSELVRRRRLERMARRAGTVPLTISREELLRGRDEE